MDQQKPKDVSNGTTGRIPDLPDHGWKIGNPVSPTQMSHFQGGLRHYMPHAIGFSIDQFHNAKNPVARTTRQSILHDLGNNTAYSSIRVLERLRNRDKARNSNASYSADDIRNLLSARTVKTNEQHWAGLGKEFAPEGKMSPDDWIKHMSQSLPRFYGVDNPGSAYGYAGNSVGGNLRLFLPADEANQVNLHMTHVNSFLPKGDDNAQGMLGDERINSHLRRKTFFHQPDDNPSEIGHHRTFSAPVRLLGKALAAQDITRMGREFSDYFGRTEDGTFQNDPSRKAVYDFGGMPAVTNVFAMLKRMDQTSNEIGNEFPRHARYNDGGPENRVLGFLTGKPDGTPVTDDEIDDLFSIHQMHIDRLKRGAKPVVWHGDLADSLFGYDKVNIMRGSDAERAEVMQRHIDLAKQQLKHLRDVIENTKALYDKDGTEEHIEEYQSDYFQHPQWFHPGEGSDTSLEDIDRQMERLYRTSENQNRARLNLYKALSKMGNINERERATNTSANTAGPLDAGADFAYRDEALSDDWLPMTHYDRNLNGMDGRPKHRLQARLAEMYHRGGLDLRVARPEIEAHVKNVTDRAMQEYNPEKILSQMDPVMQPTVTQGAARMVREVNDPSYREQINNIGTQLSDPEKHLDFSGDTASDASYQKRGRKLVSKENFIDDFDNYDPFGPDQGIDDVREMHPLYNTLRIGTPDSVHTDGSMKWDWPSERKAINEGSSYFSLGEPRPRMAKIADAVQHALYETMPERRRRQNFGGNFGSYQAGEFEPEEPELHWTRAIADKIDTLAQEYDKAEKSNSHDQEFKRWELENYLMDLTKPYRENGLHALGSETPQDGPDKNEQNQLARTQAIRDLVEPLLRMHAAKHKPGLVVSRELNNLRKKRDEIARMPVRGIIPVEKRHLFDSATSDAKPLERPIGDMESAIRFMVRHAMANAIANGADYISVSPKGIKNGLPNDVKPGSFWERLAKYGRDELTKLAREHKVAVEDVPWAYGTSKPTVKVTDSMRDHLQKHGIHAFDDGYPSTVDRVSKSVNPIGILILPSRKPVVSANSPR